MAHGNTYGSPRPMPKSSTKPSPKKPSATRPTAKGR